MDPLLSDDSGSGDSSESPHPCTAEPELQGSWLGVMTLTLPRGSVAVGAFGASEEVSAFSERGSDEPVLEAFAHLLSCSKLYIFLFLLLEWSPVVWTRLC